ncbi:MAG: CBS domain-containing protein [Candidatus Bathyarchaeota archaeon]|nr:CBS domain-containing protein [Candidatus Bathyarchaeota archaeon]
MVTIAVRELFGMIREISVKDVFSQKFSSVNENEPLSKCVELFKTENPPVLAVVDDKDRYVGVIARRWVVRARLDPATTKVKTLMRSAPKIDQNDSLSKAAKLMIQSSIRQLPVFDGEKLRGFITDEDIIHGAVTQEWGSGTVKQIMTKAPYTIESSRSVGAVLSLFRENDISHVPVMENGQLVGIISTQDIIEHVFQPNQRQTVGDIKGEKIQVLSIPAKGVMTSPVITVTPQNTLRDVEKKMHDLNVHCLVVIDKGRATGVVTKLDFLEPISLMEEADRRMTVQFAVKGAEIDESTRGFMLGEFEAVTRKYKDMLESGTLFVYMKLHGTNHKGEPLIHCRLQLRTVKGMKGFFVSSAEGWGIEPTFRVALDRLDKRILRSKELDFDPKYQKEYMRKIGFPTEL